ncbi:hypothetical protein PILCRDRAFT_93604 [Piloderma croceum F 1598]|uniref:Uncharacterized protein n=1 Tax=Piloderma croceum (strain F 1598) TaxID=765440 RepID=A0A0C3B478_PILCF|nr:hypothetical protein PILCRDRAFT_93604 [Piloderma croceum F 1598]
MSKRVLRMANGTLVPSGGTWIGRVIVGNVCAEGAFEIFPSGGAWDMLFDKPMLHAFDATHKYTGDTVTLNSKDKSETLQNSNLEPVLAGAKRLRKTKVAVAQNWMKAQSKETAEAKSATQEAAGTICKGSCLDATLDRAEAHWCCRQSGIMKAYSAYSRDKKES